MTPSTQPLECVACPYDYQRCDLPYWRGSVQGVDYQPSQAAPGGRLQLQDQHGQAITLLLTDPRWLVLLPQVERALRAARDDQGPEAALTAVAYHLFEAGPGLFSTGSGGLVILEPDWLINVTDLTGLEYCPRQYLVDRFKLSQANLHLLRGNVLHQAFEQILKTPQDGPAITAALKEAFFAQGQNMAFTDQTKAGLWVEVKDHYHRLQAWAKTGRRTGQPRSESFLLAPQLGLKGKIDALWAQDGHVSLIAELKTGQSMGPTSKPGHAFQAAAYSLMTGVRHWRPAGQETVLLYSGNTPTGSSANIERRVPISLERLGDVAYHRNQLVLSDYLLDAPYETQQPNKCIRCSIGPACAEVGFLFEHLDPRVQAARWTFNPEATLDEPEKVWFRTYARLLLKEFRAVKNQHASLWKLSPAQRAAEGQAFVAGSGRLVASELRRSVYFLAGENSSELREEDYVLVSDGRGPERGVIAQGTIKRSGEDGLEVAFSEPLNFEPRIVDAYVTENLVERQFAGLFAWLNLDSERRDLVVRRRLPRFAPEPVEPHFPFFSNGRALNARQAQVVRQALQMQDCLLVLGPPGAGKTTLIVALVRELLHRGQRILLAAGTNTALDNLLKPLVGAGLGPHILRLGAAGRTDPEVRPYVPDVLAQDPDLDTYVQNLKTAFAGRPVVGATATTWLSNQWSALQPFDVAIVDEAAQLTVPAVLGALRLARRFILIGDHKQLPAVVLSEGRIREGRTRSGQNREDTAIEAGDPLPSLEEPSVSLKKSLFENLYEHYHQACPEAIVDLNEQYRMNEAICAIPRQLWYADDLKPATPEIAHSRLALLRPLAPEHPLFPVLDPQARVVFWQHPAWLAGGGPRTNLAEARSAAQAVLAYLQAGLPLKSAGLIAPFRAQAALIRRELARLLPPETHEALREMVDTVDRFQGQERDLIIISLATYDRFIHDLLLDERRLNVAITRARHKLILLGDQAVLGQHPMYARLLALCDRVVEANVPTG